MVVDADGVTHAVIDWEWFEKYRDTLMAKVAAGKKVIPEIYQRYLDPAEKLLTLAENTYGRKAGGRIWQNHLHDLLTAPPLSTTRTSTEAAWWQHGGTSQGMQPSYSRRAPGTACPTEVETYKYTPTTC
jgi:hypothetical protein